MCGICGIIYKDPSNTVDPKILKDMSDKIIHRGPDDEGFYLHRNIGMADRRLSIIDINDGHQPFTNEDGSVVVVYNGEIYNHSELRKELKLKGHRFKSRCDTEILVHLYEEYASNLIEHLNGMFAFAIYDIKKKYMLIARDRLGIKPVYYINTDKWMIFGSEIKAFFPFPEFEAAVDYESLHQYLTFRYVPSPKTIFKEVKKLPPGSLIEVSLNNKDLRISKYWDIDFENIKENRSLAETAEELSCLIKDAVKIRLMSEVPLGAMLSGGVDSSVIVSSMKNGSQNNISTFTVDYNESGYHNEASFAKLAACAYNTDHHEIIISFKDFIMNIEKMVYFMDEVIADPAAIPIYELCRFSKKFVTVLLSGVGGDELFAGYNIYKEAVYWKYLSHVPDFLWDFLIIPLYNLMPEGTLGRNFVKRIRKPIEETFLGSSFVYGGFSEREKFNLYEPSFAECQSAYDPHEIIKKTLGQIKNASKLHKMMYVDTKHWLADSHLVMMDKMSMANSIELRAPLLDHRLVEFAASIPENLKINPFCAKIVFKKTVESEVPAPILNRAKKGFSTPFDIWVHNYDNQLADLLASKNSLINDFFDIKQIMKLISEHKQGFADCSAKLFTILVLCIWLNTFIPKR
jgi:asparagine synthase (glutamine-hydrolysing)